MTTSSIARSLVRQWGGGGGAPVTPISSSNYPRMEIGVAFDSTPVITGGTPPYKVIEFSNIITSLLGMTLVRATGHLFGTPTGTLSGFDSIVESIVVEDSSVPPLFTTAQVTLYMQLTLTGTYPNGTVGTAYNSGSAVQVAHGDSSYTITTSSGSLLPGLNYQSSSDPTLVGTPTTSGSYSFTTKAADGSGGVALLPQTIVIS